jgi:hypothetical protein
VLGQHTRVRTGTLSCIVASSPPVETLASSAWLALRLSLVNPACKRRISHKPPHAMGRSLTLPLLLLLLKADEDLKVNMGRVQGQLFLDCCMDEKPRLEQVLLGLLWAVSSYSLG